MTRLLLKCFIKNYEDSADGTVRSAIGKLSGIVGICCNLLLFAIKLLIGILSHSVSIIADALNNMTDAASSIVTLLGFKLAEQPADDQHPYGHARFEYLSGLAVAALVLVIGVELAKSSITKIFHPASIAFSPALVLVLLLSIAAKLWMAGFNQKLGDMIHSTALNATAADCRNDVIATTAVLAAALVEQFAGITVDGFMGLGVSAFILYSAIQLAKETISPLLGEAASPELQALIVDYVSSHPKVLGYHDLMVHDYGPGRRFATLHVEMDKDEDPLTCHEIIDDMERECLSSHNIHLVIHYDPIVTDDPKQDQLQMEVTACLQSMDPRLQIHDFRLVRCGSYRQLYFDIALPHELASQEAAIKAKLDTMLKENHTKPYQTIITFDPVAFHQ